MKKLIHISILIFTLSLIFHPSDISASTSILNGQVIDSLSKKPIPNATVTLIKDHHFVESTKTDLEGNYSLKVVPDIYTIQIKILGHVTYTKNNFQVTHNQSNTIDFKLKKLSALNMNSIPFQQPLYYRNDSSKYKPIKTTRKRQSPFYAPLSQIELEVKNNSFQDIKTQLDESNSYDHKSVVIEEIINYHTYDYPNPIIKTRPIKVYSRLTECPWNNATKLLHVGIQGRRNSDTTISKEESQLIAKEVSAQIEFNPAYVSQYRLIGYDNRKPGKKENKYKTWDFKEGQSITVLYEITPTQQVFEITEEKTMYQKRSKNLDNNRELGTVRIKYKTPTGQKLWEFGEQISNRIYTLENAEDNTVHASAIAELALLLKNSKYKEDATFENVKSVLQLLDKDKYGTEEVLELINKVMAIEKIIN